MYWELTYTLSKNLYSRSASWGWKIDFIWGLLCVLIDRVLALLFLIFWNLHAVCLLFPSLLWIFTYSFVQAFSCSFNKYELGALRAGGLPAGANGKEPVCQGRAVRDLGWSLSREDPLEEGMVTHPSLLAWRIPRTEKPVGLQSMGSQRVGHEGSDLAHSCVGTGLGEGVRVRENAHHWEPCALLGETTWWTLEGLQKLRAGMSNSDCRVGELFSEDLGRIIFL